MVIPSTLGNIQKTQHSHLADTNLSTKTVCKTELRKKGVGEETGGHSTPQTTNKRYRQQNKTTRRT